MIELYQYLKSLNGVPQGLSISNILAQVYLADFDEILDKRKYFYRRYVDDILIINIGKITKFRYENLNKELQLLKLEFNDEKREEGLVENGFTFLGYQISNSKVSIAEKNAERYIRRIAGKFTWYKNGLIRKNTRPTWLMNDDERFKEVFIEELNESITGIISMDRNYGWLFYFSEMTDISLLFKIDKIISGFFAPLDTFDNNSPRNLKTLVRTFYFIKHRTKNNYIANYGLYDTIRKKRNFLEFRGFIDPENEYTDWQITNLFTKYRNKQIRHVEQDIGYAYI
jgi:RNA-directed DNA polymerase